MGRRGPAGVRVVPGDAVAAKQPGQQLRDRNDNVQRLLRVLDRDGSAGLLASAMDGGVTVELLDGRGTPYWAVFQVVRSGNGVREGEADDGRDMYPAPPRRTARTRPKRADRPAASWAPES
ncbi:hypothetical protein ABZ154_18550 [Streptomyces sp. NPDC006261]|uniref:hypothetical protein n=1 Tax=Streptomyces sp. NPDC006261 TaxID=3156739 RepID=UPI0033BA3A08